MAVTKIIENLDTNNGWLEVGNISGDHGAFIIAIKGDSTDNDVLPIDKLQSVNLEIGIPSGISKKPITLQTLKLDFTSITSLSDAELDTKTACTKIGPMPSTVYIKPIGYSDGLKEHKVGSMPVSINILHF